MLDKMRKALGIAGAPSQARAPTQLVPVSHGYGRPVPQASYISRGSDGPSPAGWGTPGYQPLVPLRSADLDVRMAWSTAAAHIRHLVQNSGWLAGAIDQAVAYTVGTGLKPEIVPDAESLGWSQEFARGWARTVERAFSDWANNPIDADDRQQATFGALQAAALRTWFVTGDIVAVSTYRRRRNALFSSAVSLLDPIRIAVPPLGQYGSVKNVMQGIEMDEYGTPVAFWVKPLPGDHGQGLRIPVWGPNNRQAVVHAFLGEAGQIRGISPFAPVIEAMRQTVSVNDSMTLAAATAASIIGTITSDLPTASIMPALGGEDHLTQSMSMRTAYHEQLAAANAAVTIGPHGRVHHLATGERFDLHAGKNHYEHFPEHMKVLLREIARASGLPYETFTLDRSAATYSSGRLGITDFWAITEMRRATLVEPMCRLALQNLVEEMIDRRMLKYPGGIAAYRMEKTLATRARWVGPAKPQADELKAVRASIEGLKWGLTSLSRETAENGADWEQIMQARAEEQRMARELGLEFPPPTVTKRITEGGGL